MLIKRDCKKPFAKQRCFNNENTDFALCFFMVLDLRLKIVGCRETADFSFYISAKYELNPALVSTTAVSA